MSVNEMIEYAQQLNELRRKICSMPIKVYPGYGICSIDIKIKINVEAQVEYHPNGSIVL